MTQRFNVGDAGFFQHACQRGLLFAHLRGFGPVLGRYIVFRHLQPILLGQVFDGLDKRHASMVHQKTDGVAVFAATKAVIKLLGRADTERRGFFAVKRAQPHKVGSALFQLNMPADNVNDVSACQQLLNKGLRNSHGGILT